MNDIFTSKFNTYLSSFRNTISTIAIGIAIIGFANSKYFEKNEGKYVSYMNLSGILIIGLGIIHGFSNITDSDNYIQNINKTNISELLNYKLFSNELIISKFIIFIIFTVFLVSTWCHFN